MADMSCALMATTFDVNVCAIKGMNTDVHIKNASQKTSQLI